jgi:hypothetical protein
MSVIQQAYYVAAFRKAADDLVAQRFVGGIVEFPFPWRHVAFPGREAEYEQRVADMRRAAAELREALARVRQTGGEAEAESECVYGIVMPGLVPGIHVFACRQDVDGRAYASPKGLLPRRRDKPGHDA